MHRLLTRLGTQGRQYRRIERLKRRAGISLRLTGRGDSFSYKRQKKERNEASKDRVLPSSLRNNIRAAPLPENEQGNASSSAGLPQIDFKYEQDRYEQDER